MEINTEVSSSWAVNTTIRGESSWFCNAMENSRTMSPGDAANTTILYTCHAQCGNAMDIKKGQIALPFSTRIV